MWADINDQESFNEAGLWPEGFGVILKAGDHGAEGPSPWFNPCTSVPRSVVRLCQLILSFTGTGVTPVQQLSLLFGNPGMTPWFSHPFHVVVQSDPHPVPLAQHLAGHEGVEDARAHQGQAEIEAKKPPVLHIPVELRGKGEQLEKGKGQAGEPGHELGLVLPVQTLGMCGSVTWLP